MDELERKILTAFERAGVSRLSLAELGGPPVSAKVQWMVAHGWLRRADNPDSFARTEDGRLHVARPTDVTIYTRSGCHLCDEAKAQIAPLLREYDARLTEIDIDQDAELRARYDFEVPVIFLEARMVAKHRVDLAQFQRQLRDASALLKLRATRSD